jgi:WD40-like Beta Propeller Repeat
VHELTHVFQFDIIPQSLVRRQAPLWMSEGQADYERGLWDPLDLMMVRDAAVSDTVPKMSKLEGYGNSSNPRLIYNLGHAVFEFIESRWGKEGVRQFMFSLRKSVIGGGGDAYQETFQLKPEDFDQQFDTYLKDRFKPFRDKERPADYGRNLAPDPEKGPFVNALTIEASPSGDLLAVATVNRRDGEIDLVLVSAKDGEVVRNLTPGFDKDRGYENISVPSQFITVPWMSWGPKGDLLAYFVRTEKSKTLVLENVLTRKIEQRIQMTSIDEPESPSISPDGRMVAFAGLRSAKGDIFTVDLGTGEIVNLTDDEFGNYAPTYSPDGTFIVYLARVSGNYKLFRVDLDTKKKTQLTFGTFDEGAAKFHENDELVFASTALDPAMQVEPEVARNGNIYNIWTLNLKTGALQQFTDALGGDLSPVVLGGQAGAPRIAFVSYYKGEYGLHVLEPKEPLKTAATADFGAPGPIIDFQAPLSHTLIGENKRKKGPFEKMFLDGAPPVNVGMTSGGDLFGGTALAFADVLGDKQFTMIASSVSQYRTLAFSYANLARRFQYAVQGYSQTLFYYGELGGILYDPIYNGIINRDLALATRTMRGGSFFGIYPMNRYTRLEFSAGLVNFEEAYADPGVQQVATDYQQQQFGRQIFNNGTLAPLGVDLVQETTVFREFGPLAGSTMRLSYNISPKVANFLSRQSVDVDARHYIRLGGTGLLALRARGFRSWGAYPDYVFFGGNSEMHGYQYLEFLGQNVFFGDAELRFPFIEAMATPIGILGGIRGVMFFNIGGGWFGDQNFKFWDTKPERYSASLPPNIDFNTGTITPVTTPPQTITGFRLRDSRASYGIGLETFAIGFPIHFDWSWRTLFNKQWEDALFAADGGSSKFRRPRFDVWIGYDF